MEQVISNPTDQFSPNLAEEWERKADRLGVVASVLCAIHCVATPFILLLLPAFGKVWAHPATHWGVALFVVPIAALMISKGYQRHRAKWIVGIGVAGIILVLSGAIAPYFDPLPNEAFSGVHSGNCCARVSPAEGKLHVPLASILTTAGGLLLIATHVTNLCRCPSCKDSKCSG